MSDATWDEKLRWMEKHAHEVIVRINEHRGHYEDLAEWLKRDEDEADDVRARCIAAGSAVVVQVYPITPIGFYHVIDSDLPRAVERAYAAVSAELRTADRPSLSESKP